jgi:hypothetical protein
VEGQRRFAVVGKHATVPEGFVVAAGAELGPDVIESDLVGLTRIDDGTVISTKRRPHEV